MELGFIVGEVSRASRRYGITRCGWASWRLNWVEDESLLGNDDHVAGCHVRVVEGWTEGVLSWGDLVIRIDVFIFWHSGRF